MPAAVPTHFLPGVQYVPTTTSQKQPSLDGNPGSHIIDGTPARVASIGVIALALIVGMRWAGIKFNVAIGS